MPTQDTESVKRAVAHCLYCNAFLYTDNDVMLPLHCLYCNDVFIVSVIYSLGVNV